MSQPDLSDHLSGDSTIDWRGVAFRLAETLRTFAPADWLVESDGDLIQYVAIQVQWLEDKAIPALQYYNLIEQSYDQPEPF